MEQIRINKAIVLAGGNDQIELIKGLRNRYEGVEIILIDMAPNVRAKEFADKHLLISTMDYDAVLQVAKEEKVDLIIVACGDQPLITMAHVSETLRLPCYLTYQQALNFTNKIYMKNLMIQNNIPTSKYQIIDLNDVSSIEGLEFPLVVKPADNNGSKGIVKVYNYSEYLTAIEEAKKYTVSGGLLVEEYIEGEEYSVEGFIHHGEPSIIIATKNIKIKNKNNRFTILQNEYINQLSDNLKNDILGIIKQIGRSFGIDNVPLLIQMIVNKDKVSVIEFSARTGGGSKMFFIREMVNVDVIDNLLDITEGKTPNIETKPSRQYASINYIYLHPGLFSKIEGMKELTDEGYVADFYLYKQLGTRVLSSNYSSDRPAGFLVRANSEQELHTKVLYVDSHLKVLNENGEDIMIHSLYYKK